jgi:two-component system, chemotaxis family, CheB/CheR fusion protein
MDTKNVQVVGIGASAGGIDALKEFFSEMPNDSGLAFVVIQHLDPVHVSYMANLLTKCTEMKVVQAEDEMPTDANCVYTIPPGKFLLLKNGMLHLAEPVKNDGLRLPVDFFFRSLAQDQHEKAIGVILSGSGSDGTLGIREIRGAGGIVIVQDPKTTQFDSMAQSAVATGLVDYVLSVKQMPEVLLRYVRQSTFEGGDHSSSEAIQNDINAIVNLMLSQTKSDFRPYRKATIQRRILRRMAIKQMDKISDYLRFLGENHAELASLSKDMLIGVTSFFRDPEAFEELRGKVIAQLVEEKDKDTPLRVWIAGCATGEEAYSIVMLLMEEVARGMKRFPIQVFASDSDPEALKYAREASYPESIAVDVSEERLARFFIKKNNSYQISKEVRELVTFAEHNVITDPPFLKMDLISCRNLLIYIEPEMQKKLLTLFGFALNAGRYLFLGKSESVIEQINLFEPVSRKFRIYRRKESVPVQAANFPVRPPGAPVRLVARPERPPVKLLDLNQQVLLKHFNASIVLTAENGDILHFYGPSHKYLAHPLGDANLNLFDLIESRHSSKLRRALEKVARGNHKVTLDGLDFSRDDSTRFANVTITPVVEPKSGERLLAVIFEEARPPMEASSPRGTEISDDALVKQHEAESKTLKEELQATIDDFQTTHEEFTAANE